ncbi:hypothetical protein [Serratia fonticola]|uniref:hypothetical protein n=1 Tax=Serratia fonticola TaxID=47917 RepID=UPI0024DE84A1|nr:hypothetical protein [Serratia fonticola]MDK2377289.1 hypothetical protein [Serratia fonticola]
MQKKTRTEAGIVEQASAFDNSASHHAKPAPKKHRARRYMLFSGVNGFTENEILRYCRLSSGRNYPTELERALNITLERIDEKNPDGIGSHFRYRIMSRLDALRVIDLMKYHASVGGYSGLTKEEVRDILDLYPDTPAAA